MWLLLSILLNFYKEHRTNERISKKMHANSKKFYQNITKIISNTNQTQYQCIPSAEQMHVNHMSKRRASRAKRGEWCMTMLRKMLARCPNRLPMLAHARIILHQFASVCTRLAMFINVRTCLPMLACDCTRFAFICPRLPMLANAWTCYPTLDKVIILKRASRSC